MMEPARLDEVTFLEERDFQSARHQVILKVMRYLSEKNKPIDLVSITETCERFGGVNNVGGVPYLTHLATSCPSAASIGYYAGIIRSKAFERRIKSTGEIIKDMSRDDYESDDEFFSYVERLVGDLRPQNSEKVASLYELKDEYYTHLKTPAEFIKTGFKEYDKWAKGLWRQWLFVSAGRPSVGKTAMLLNRLYGVAQQKEGAVVLFSQEMGRTQIIDRIMSSVTGISYQRIKTKNLNDKEWNTVDMFYKDFEYLPFYIQDTPAVTIEEVRAVGRQLKKKHGKLAAIAVDYLQIMSIPKAKNETRAEAIGRVTGTSKNIARELNCCFIMLSQMTRDGDNGQRPTLGQLKESSSIEQDADVVEFLWSEGKTHKNGKIIKQTFAKGRDIGVNEFDLLFMNWQQKFIEMVDGEGGK